MGKTANLKLWVVILAILVSASLARAGTTITVGPGGGYNYSTIQAGINAAVGGDTVIVADGNYTGADNKNLYFGGKAITVQSENGPENCIINCEDDGRGFVFDNSGEGADSVVSGFTILDGNSNNDNGGAIKCVNTDPTITDCIISSCDATATNIVDDPGATCPQYGSKSGTGGRGGGIFCNNADPTITNCTFTDNTSVFHGAAITCFNSSSPTIANCTFSNNTTDSRGDAYQAYGGGIICVSSGPTIADCTFTNNYAIEGGAIYCYNYSGPSPTITNCTIVGNTGRDYGGGIFCEGSDPNITNCTITGNTSPNLINPNCYPSAQGGGIYLANAEPTITNCTIWGNTAGAYGGGIMSWSNQSSVPVITNCIVRDNPPHGILQSGSFASISYCNAGGYPGVNNINADPLFVDANGPDDIVGTVDDNPRLLASSPCIDRGSNAAVPSGITTDLDGRPRITDGDCNTTNIVDMGAYEFAWAYIGDFAGGCDVDFKDFSVLGLSWLLEEGQAGYDPNCDINIPTDDVINKKDLDVFCDNWLAVFP